MKPCSKNRKGIAWLALNALDAREERSLREHLENCAGCRAYLAEISNVAEKLVAAEVRSDIQTSQTFHQKVVGRLRAEESRSENVLTHLRAILSNWRVALPVIAAASVLIAALSLVVRHPSVSSPAKSGAQVTPVPKVKNDLDPTIANYQMVANQSFEKLDELLIKQGNRNPSPTRIYTASSLAPANASD